MNAPKAWGEQQNGDKLELIRGLLYRIAHDEQLAARRPKTVAMLVLVDEGRTFNPLTGLWYGPDGWPVTPADAALKYHLGRKP
jgi:hypothetical protein